MCFSFLGIIFCLDLNFSLTIKEVEINNVPQGSLGEISASLLEFLLTHVTNPHYTDGGGEDNNAKTMSQATDGTAVR
jgi:hypothetical protein